MQRFEPTTKAESLQNGSTQKTLRFSSYNDSAARQEAVSEDRRSLIHRLFLTAAFVIPSTINVILLFNGNLALTHTMWRSPLWYLFNYLLSPAIYIGFLQWRSHRSKHFLKTQVDLPSPGVQFLAKTEIKYDAVNTCVDNGVLTFMDGYIQFEGIRTNFGLRSQDVSNLDGGFNTRSTLPGNLPLRIEFYPLEAPSTKRSRIWFLDRLRSKTKREFKACWEEWQKTPAKEIDTSVFPPVEIYTTPFTTVDRLLNALLPACYLGFIAPCILGSVAAGVVVALFAATGQLFLSHLLRNSLKRHWRMLKLTTSTHPAPTTATSISSRTASQGPLLPLESNPKLEAGEETSQNAS